jgi:hypothetical protein
LRQANGRPQAAQTFVGKSPLGTWRPVPDLAGLGIWRWDQYQSGVWQAWQELPESIAGF